MAALSKVLLVALLSSTVVACGGSSDSVTAEATPDTSNPDTVSPTTTIEQEFGLWLTDLANTHVLPSYQTLQDTASSLSSETTSFCSHDVNSNDQLLVLQQSWKDVMSAWQTIQWLKIGPIIDDNRLYRLHYWPDSKATVSAGITSLLATSDTVTEAYVSTRSVGSQGLPAIEQLLFTSASADNLLNAADKDKRCEVLSAISGNVAAIASAVNSEWKVSEGNYFSQLTQGTGEFSSTKDAVEELVTNWLEQLERVKDEKMLVPLSSASPGLPEVAENILSEQSVASIKQNMASFSALYTAGEGHGFDDILIDYLDQQNIATEMSAAIEAAIIAADVLTDDYETLLKTESGRAQITATIDALRTVRDLLTVDFVQATDINIGFNSNDGD